MNINELAQNILKQDDERLSKAFTMCISGLLISNGIQPILNKTCEEWSENDDLNKYIMRREYQVSFDIDTTEHDKKVKEKAIDEFKQGFYEHAHFEPWSMKFEIYQSDLLNWLEQLKEQKE